MLLIRYRLLLSFGLLLALPAWAGTSMSFASGQSLFLTPSFQTAGVIIKTANDDGNETIAVEVKGPTDTAFHAVHPTTRFEPNGWATSLFDLKQDTDYSLRITLADPDGVTGTASQTVTIHTLPEPVTPVPLRTLYVSTFGTSSGPGTTKANAFDSIDHAAAHAQPGDQIRVLSGTYGIVDIESLQGTATAPIWFAADDASHPPNIAGNSTGNTHAFTVKNSSYIIVDGFEIQNGGGDGDADNDGGVGLFIVQSTHVTAQNNYIHDNGHYDVLISKSALYMDADRALSTTGYHLIQNNRIADVNQVPCGNDNSHDECPTITYYGVKQDNNPGAANVIRNNEIWGHSDNMSPCGDEDVGDDLHDGLPIMAIIGNGDGMTTGIWTNHDMEIYGNNIHDARDDAMELDGICANARVWHNTLNGAQNGFSVAPALPGPYFLVRNVVTGAILEGGVKLNTDVDDPQNATRHIFVYQNSFIWTQAETGMLNLWYADPGQQSLLIHDIRFRNNIFDAAFGAQLTNVVNQSTEQPSFDGDDWYSPTQSNELFQWGTDSTKQDFATFAAFQQGSGQEEDGIFGQPTLDSSWVPVSGSIVIDKAIAIPGINDRYTGNAPDIGAYEFGAAEPADGGTTNPDGGTIAVLPDGGPLPGTVVSSCGCTSTSDGFLAVTALFAAATLAGRIRRRKADRSPV